MKNLWLFLVKYNAFFWFLLFFTFSIILVIRNNKFQQSAFINSSNSIIGNFYTKFNSWKAYISLNESNQLLAKENASLHEQIQVLKALELTHNNTQLDSAFDHVRYEFIPATVINNNIKQKNNFITLNKGTKDGIAPKMGVITTNGVVGTVLNVSENFCTVESILNSATVVSVSLDSISDAFGALVWGDNYDPRYAIVKDIPNHIKATIGQAVYTNGFSTKFPKGIKVGKVIETDLASGGSFKDLRIELTTNFTNLSHVYIVKDKLAKEIIELESLNKDNG